MIKNVDAVEVRCLVHAMHNPYYYVDGEVKKELTQSCC